MPWKVFKDGNRYCVHKINDATGEKLERVACHDSREKANAQMRALYANEGESMKTTTAVKALGEDRIGGYLVVWGDAAHKDLQGEYFTPDSELGLDWYPVRPALYHHGLDGTIKSQTVGVIDTLRSDKMGVWAEAQLKANVEYRDAIKRLIKKGVLSWSSGTLPHLVESAPDGWLKFWPIVEGSLTPTPAEPRNTDIVALKAAYKSLGLDVSRLALDEYENQEDCQDCGTEDSPRGATAQAVQSDGAGAIETENPINEDRTMNDEILQGDAFNEAVDARVKSLFESEAQRRKEEQERAQKIEEDKQAAVKAARQEWEAEAVKAGRLPFNADNAPVAGKFGELRQYENLSLADTAFVYNTLANGTMQNGRPCEISDALVKALIVKTEDDKSRVGHYGRMAVKAMEHAGLKANEVNYSTLATYGDEWVGVLYGQQVWDSVRYETQIASKLPSMELPYGVESKVIPLENTDPTFYVVGEVASDAATGGKSEPAPTAKSSRVATGNQTMTLKKLGARVRWSTELQESSLVPFADQLNRQLNRAAMEQFEHVIIDGDTATTGSTNINTAATTVTGSEAFLSFNGFRKIALGNNSRSAGTLTANDYLSTAEALGAGGKVGADPRRTAFIIDGPTWWATQRLVTELQTADTWKASAPMMESGVFAGIWGRPVMYTYSMHWTGRNNTGYEYKANTSGYVDTATAANNTTGSILCVRWDQWMLGWMRHMKVVSEYNLRWDGYELGAFMRFGLINRDTAAAAISYNVALG